MSYVNEREVCKLQKKIFNDLQNFYQEHETVHCPQWSYFSGLSGNLILSSWFLYDLFSKVRIIFFTELSSTGSACLISAKGEEKGEKIKNK